MRSMSEAAGYMALDELKEGRKTLILFPDKSWGAVMFEMGTWPEGIFPATCEDEEFSEVDTIITVDDAACDQEAVKQAGGTKRIRIFRGEREDEIELLD